MVAGGEQSGYGILTVREQLWMFSQFYGIGTRDGWKRTDELIEAVGLGEQRLQRVSTLSTGQRQKMNMARGLLNDPWILFLDEPTLGLDVAAARSIRELVLDWKGAVAGRTVLLTTHYMAEADELCERIAIVDHGRILAIGTPGRAQEAGPAGVDLPARARQPRRGHRPRSSRLPGVVSAAPAADSDPELQRIAVNLVLEEDAALGGVVTALAGIGSHILALRKSEPTLEDVFVELVGRGFGDDGQAAATPGATGPTGRGRTARPGRRAATTRPMASRTCRPRPAPTRPRRPTRWRRADDGRHRARGRPRRRAPRVDLRLVPQRHGPAGGVGVDASPGRREQRPRARGPGVPARPRHGPRAVVGVLRDPAPVPDDVGVRPRLPHPAGARGLRRLRRPRRRDGGVLAQRRVDDGRPALLGEGPGQPRALLRRPDEPDVGAAGDGRRRPDHELDAGPRDPRGVHAGCSASRSTSSSGACCSRCSS